MMSETIGSNPEIERKAAHANIRSFVEAQLADQQPDQWGAREANYRVSNNLLVDQVRIRKSAHEDGPIGEPKKVWSEWSVRLGSSSELNSYNKGLVMEVGSIDNGEETLLHVNCAFDGEFPEDNASLQAASELIDSVKLAIEAGQLQKIEE